MEKLRLTGHESASRFVTRPNDSNSTPFQETQSEYKTNLRTRNMIVKKLKEFLDKHGIEYISLTHSKAFTAQKVAASAHIPGKELAKTVILKIDGKMAMAILPASYRVDFNQLKGALGAKKVELAQEKEFKDIFPNCEVGAMPPFGNLWDMGIFVAESLSENEEIAFNAGSHTELVKMKFSDYKRLTNPVIIKYSFR
jgi:Ala-tRNA(Pro) deacylase